MALTSGHVSAQSSSAGPQRDKPGVQTGTGIIRGRILGPDAMPLRRVQVKLLALTDDGSEPRTTVTGDDGRYEFAQLPSGRYGVSASKGGYVDIEYGQRRPFEKGRPIDLADKQTLERIDMRLPPGGVVSGRVVDETGEPVARAWVQLARYKYMNGARRLIGMFGDSTDDRGEYRIFGIPPADYLLSATFSGLESRSTDRVRYVRTFVPGTSSAADAQPIPMKLGEDLSGLTIALVREQTAAISGIVRYSTPSPLPLGFVVAHRKGEDSEGHDGIARADGAFSIGGLLPGTYVVEAQSFGGERASTEVVVSGADVAGVVLTLSGGVRARGQIRFEGGNPPPDLLPSQLLLFAVSPDNRSTSMDGSGLKSPVRPDWSFELTGVMERALITGGSAGAWQIKAVSLNGDDFTDTPIDFSNGDVAGIDVLLSNRTTKVAGVVSDDRGATAGDTSVVIFPAEPDRWTRSRFIRTARPDQQGRYEVSGLPAARYLAIAVDYLEEGAEHDPDRLKEWSPAATSFTLGDGETRTLNLTVRSTN